MKKFKKIAAAGAIALLIGVTSTAALAASGYNAPADIISGLTGKTTEAVIAEKVDTGKTYGTIANEAGVLDAFEDQMLEARKALIEERVAAGTMTRERADAIIAAMEENQSSCDGTGIGGAGTGMGAGFGMSGSGAGCGTGSGMGTGRGGMGGRGAGFAGNGCAIGTGTGTSQN